MVQTHTLLFHDESTFKLVIWLEVFENPEGPETGVPVQSGSESDVPIPNMVRILIGVQVRVVRA